MFIYMNGDRSGYWEINFKRVIEILPHFHISDHISYANAAHLYAKEMKKLYPKSQNKN